RQSVEPRLDRQLLELGHLLLILKLTRCARRLRGLFTAQMSCQRELVGGARVLLSRLVGRGDQVVDLLVDGADGPVQERAWPVHDLDRARPTKPSAGAPPTAVRTLCRGCGGERAELVVGHQRLSRQAGLEL